MRVRSLRLEAFGFAVHGFRLQSSLPWLLAFRLPFPQLQWRLSTPKFPEPLDLPDALFAVLSELPTKRLTRSTRNGQSKLAAKQGNLAGRVQIIAVFRLWVFMEGRRMGKAPAAPSRS